MLRLVARGRGAARGDCDGGDELARSSRCAEPGGETQSPTAGSSSPFASGWTRSREGAARAPARPASGCDAHHGTRSTRPAERPRGRSSARSSELPGATLAGGDPVAGPIVLVCTHGRRDACCARLGLPLFDALAPHLPPERLWQSSHLGGHRFAPNVLVLPHGIQLGRIPLERAAEVAELLEDGRIPLDLYRGRTIYRRRRSRPPRSPCAR